MPSDRWWLRLGYQHWAQTVARLEKYFGDRKKRLSTDGLIAVDERT